MYPNGKRSYDACSLNCTRVDNDMHFCDDKDKTNCNGEGDHDCDRNDICPQCKSFACELCLVECGICKVAACERCFEDLELLTIYNETRIPFYRCKTCDPPLKCDACVGYIDRYPCWCRVKYDECNKNFCPSCIFNCQQCNRDYCWNHMDTNTICKQCTEYTF
uniref:Uncharacterized protein n=1 Tax=viral metagenome TaxID=1070528 RepID=A0A6C0JQ91_9ZZZZ